MINYYRMLIVILILAPIISIAYPLGPRNLPVVKGYQIFANSEPMIKQISVFCMPIQTAPVFPWYETCIW